MMRQKRRYKYFVLGLGLFFVFFRGEFGIGTGNETADTSGVAIRYQEAGNA